jgi:hypothetical protein
MHIDEHFGPQENRKAKVVHFDEKNISNGTK